MDQSESGAAWSTQSRDTSAFSPNPRGRNNLCGPARMLTTIAATTGCTNDTAGAALAACYVVRQRMTDGLR